HNNYSTREAVEYLMQKYSIQKIDTVADIKGSKTEKKRWLKERIYNRLPLFLRAFLYYIYRYVLKLGFLDGKEGLIFHFLQGFWYRFLVDAKIYEIEKRARVENRPVQEIIEEFLSAMRQK
ncbi:MAG: glycosyltransferase family 2 protein, partial [candidate division WOR-3 bacterium]